MSKKNNNNDIIDYKNGPLSNYILNLGSLGKPNVDFDGDGKVGLLDSVRYWEEYREVTKNLSSEHHEQDEGIDDLDLDNLDIQELQELIDDGDLDSDEIDQIQELIKFKEEYDMNLFDDDDDNFDSDDSFDFDFDDNDDDSDYEYNYDTQVAPKKKEGIWVYYDEDRYKWNFTKAMLDYDTRLKEDCGEDCDETITDLLEDIIVFDTKRALDDWHFLLKTFPAETLNKTYVSEYDSFNISANTFYQLSWNYDNENAIVEFMKQPDVFEYFFEKAYWEKHKIMPFEDIFRCLHHTKNDDYIIKVYFAFKNSQKDKYSKRDLSKILEYPIHNKYWEELPKKVQDDIKSELQEIGDFGKKVLIEIEKYEKELEDDEYYDEIDQDEFEDDETEEDDNPLENKIDNAINEKLQKINEFNAKIEPIVVDIENGKILDENYKKENNVFDFCFTRGSRIYEIVTRYILSKNGKVEDVNENLLLGKIPSSEIETIFMLISVNNTFEKYNKIKNGIKPLELFDNKLIEINTPLIEFICKFYNPAKLILLFDQGYSLCDPIPKIDEFKNAYMLCQKYIKQAKQDASKIFDEITTSGEVVAPWKEEKKLYTYAELNYPNAIFKYSPDWAKGLCFDIFIPSKSLVIEYVPPLIKNATKFDIEKHKKDMQKYELKRKLCKEHNLIFADWQNETPINETNFLELMRKI